MDKHHCIFRKSYSAAGIRQTPGELAAFSDQERQNFALFWLADQAEDSLMLGYFTSEAILEEHAKRFILKPLTTPAIALGQAEAQQLRRLDTPPVLPPLHGVFGTAFSGYLLKPDSEEASDKLMLFYTADYRSELLGVFDAAEATQVLTEHYDRRRQQCMLC
ncbi:hypothetical protein [Oceanospirillum linum]|uniref:Uncharacterized protein n=1 Tax=Oceanospirillum linum TaxID=966 RepID=A0A1T1HB21_OCELI|nr:hypothetical protein [Oceanospirillum linum]OOV87013.1 hypothetical protein BTA35_0208340 [Oceanospirillum linum]SEF71569.1 hypothetical protein SAMN04489856_10264 [Oleiphilus messinensis]SMP15652.1 hypothetical protein SAMN06264348_10362 [Oceanospirillum linum]